MCVTRTTLPRPPGMHTMHTHHTCTQCTVVLIKIHFISHFNSHFSPQWHGDDMLPWPDMPVARVEDYLKAAAQVEVKVVGRGIGQNSHTTRSGLLLFLFCYCYGYSHTALCYLQSPLSVYLLRVVLFCHCQLRVCCVRLLEAFPTSELQRSDTGESHRGV